MSKLLKSSGIFAMMTFVSRIFGLIRDIVIAKYFDTNTTDAFFAALRIPNTLRRFFAEGGFANAFVPVLNETKEQESDKELQTLINSTFTVLGLILIGITLLGILFAGYIISIGFNDKTEQIELATTMLRITFPYILFISMTAFFAGILNSYHKFALPAFIPAILNITLIIAALLFRDFFDEPSIALAWGVFVGGVIQFAVQIPTLRRLKRLPKFNPNFAHKGVRKILKLMVPTLLGSSAGQINILLNTFLASTLVTGSISWLYYSDRLVELPIALIGVALGTVILPKLSALKSNFNSLEFTDTLTWAVKIAIMVGLPAAIGLIFLAFPLMSTLFQRGEFGANDTLMASKSLQIFGIGAFFLVMTKVLAPGFYSRQDTKTPVKIGLFCILVNIVISLSLFKTLGYIGLAIASTVSAFINTSLLFAVLWREKYLKVNQSFLLFFLNILVASLIMAISIAVTEHYLIDRIEWQDFTQIKRISTLFMLVFVGIFSYLLALIAVRINPMKLLKP